MIHSLYAKFGEKEFKQMTFEPLSDGSGVRVSTYDLLFLQTGPEVGEEIVERDLVISKVMPLDQGRDLWKNWVWNGCKKTLSELKNS